MSGLALRRDGAGMLRRWPYPRAGRESAGMARKPLIILAFVYLIAATMAGSMRLDGDEFTFVKEPYELLGGDYTVGYVRSGEYAPALASALKAYYFYWKYRPLFSPVVAEEDKALFGPEEKRFGYTNPHRAGQPAEKNEAAYRKRLVVPEPDRFYAHGAGKPLLAAIVNIPALALVGLATRNGPDLLSYQYQYKYHPIFILVRLSAILFGLATLVLVYLIAEAAWGRRRAILAGALFLAYPPVLLYFPNIHHDAYMVPFLLLAAWGVVKERYVMAGIGLGLALASKNTAIFMLPAVVAFLAWQWWRARGSAARSGTGASLATPARALLVITAFAAAALLPFAHPVSYAQEVLTPVSGREYDPRGEDVSSFTLAGAQTGGSEVRKSVLQLQRVIPWNAFLAFVLLGILACGPRLRDPMAALCFFFLLMMFPHSLVFGQGLGYRSLMFAPFFCLAAVRLSTARWCAPAIALLALADLVVLVDPLTARG
jgi:Dolichyl-phosphate-mannose-protein mannosyltransferase